MQINELTGNNHALGTYTIPAWLITARNFRAKPLPPPYAFDRRVQGLLGGPCFLYEIHENCNLRRWV